MRREAWSSMDTCSSFLFGRWSDGFIRRCFHDVFENIVATHFILQLPVFPRVHGHQPHDPTNFAHQFRLTQFGRRPCNCWRHSFRRGGRFHHARCSDVMLDNFGIRKIQVRRKQNCVVGLHVGLVLAFGLVSVVVGLRVIGFFV